MAVTAEVEIAYEEEQVWAWRFGELVALGMAPETAESLVHQPDIAHKVGDLIRSGCPPETAARIFAPD